MSIGMSVKASEGRLNQNNVSGIAEDAKAVRGCSHGGREANGVANQFPMPDAAAGASGRDQLRRDVGYRRQRGTGRRRDRQKPSTRTVQPKALLDVGDLAQADFTRTLSKASPSRWVAHGQDRAQGWVAAGHRKVAQETVHGGVDETSTGRRVARLNGMNDGKACIGPGELNYTRIIAVAK